MKKRRGFTLLELLMVVIIIGILASIALPQYLRSAERARSAEALQLLSAIRSSELRFKATNAGSFYTQDYTQLDIDLPGVVPPGPVTVFTTPVGGVPVWSFAVTGTGPTQNAEATRTSTGNVVVIDLDTGTICGKTATAASVYGLNPPGGSC
ncbi:MAG: type II secretion system protein [Candidatus Omnitrophota bacterium]|nr:type II secretion system protein [Candidatus Omnitrophota bacterium]